MKKIRNQVYTLSLLPALSIILSFASLGLKLFPAPLYFGFISKYLMMLTVVLLIFTFLKMRDQFLKTLIGTMISLSFYGIWTIQTA